MRQIRTRPQPRYAADRVHTLGAFATCHPWLMAEWALSLLLFTIPLCLLWLSRRFYAPGGEGFRRAESPEHAAQLRSAATQLCALVLASVAMTLAREAIGPLLVVPVVLVLLSYVLYIRRGRNRLRTELRARVESGEIVAGTPANWISGSRRTERSGALILNRESMVSWEPGRTAAKRGLRVRSWPLAQSHFELLKAGRDQTGERCLKVRLQPLIDQVDVIPHGLSAKFVLFTGVGPLNEVLGLPI